MLWIEGKIRFTQAALFSKLTKGISTCLTCQKPKLMEAETATNRFLSTSELFLNDDKYKDVIIKIEKPEKDFTMHRIVLEQAEYFKKLLSKEWKEQTPIFTIQHVPNTTRLPIIWCTSRERFDYFTPKRFLQRYKALQKRLGFLNLQKSWHGLNFKSSVLSIL